jgi:tetratricopeptide (TPR) repeat protein
MVQAAPGAPADQQETQYLKAQGNTAFKAYRLNEAIELYSAAMARAPADPIFCANRSAALYEQGKYTESLADIDTALSNHPQDALAGKLALRAARCALWLNDFDAAEQWLQHSSLRTNKDLRSYAARVSTQLQNCKAAALQASTETLRALAAGCDYDAPGLLRDCIRILRPTMYPTGHDDPHSLLDGTL